MEALVKKLLGRKFVMTALIVAVAVAVDLVHTGGLSQTLADFLQTLALGFFAGNGAEHLAGAIKTRRSDAVVDGEPPIPQPIAEDNNITPPTFNVAPEPNPELAALSAQVAASHGQLRSDLALIADGVAYVAGHVKKVQTKGAV